MGAMVRHWCAQLRVAAARGRKAEAGRKGASAGRYARVGRVGPGSPVEWGRGGHRVLGGKDDATVRPTGSEHASREAALDGVRGTIVRGKVDRAPQETGG